MTPFFSIITPLYNGAQYFHTLKNQVFGQTHSDWEWIIVDDFSTDDSYELFSSLKDDPRIFVTQRDPRIYKTIHGPYAARNHALSIASGSYVIFLDVDDLWTFNKLESDFVSIKELSNPDILYSQTYVFVSGSAKLPVLRSRLNILPPKIAINIYNPFPMLSTIVRKSSINSTRFRAINHEDYIFWYEILCSSPDLTIKFSHNVNTFYRISPQSLSGNKLAVIPWWLQCYKFMGHNIVISFLLLLFRISLYCIEFVYMRSYFVRRCPFPHSFCNE